MKTVIQQALEILFTRQDLSYELTELVMVDIMSGKCTDAQIAAWLTAMNLKGETAQEIAAGIAVMRQHCTKVRCSDTSAIDIVGTGGDGLGTWNISTASAFVAAGAGVTVAKHGNRALSGKSGSADVLSVLGIKTDCSLEKIEYCLSNVGIAFLFAPLLHPAMKYTIGPRREMAVRTLFNLLGPMTNPAGVRRGLVGVYSRHYCEILAHAAAKLGDDHLLFVHGHDGLDEISVTNKSRVYEVKQGSVQEYDLSPEDFGLKRYPMSDLLGGDPQKNALELEAVLAGKTGAYRDAIILNAAAGIYCSGKVKALTEGVVVATKSIDSGAALAKLKLLRECSNS